MDSRPAGGQGLHAAGSEDVRAQWQQLIHSALGIGQDFSLDLVHGGHALAL